MSQPLNKPDETHAHDFKQIEGQSSLECECGAVPDYAEPPHQPAGPPERLRGCPWCGNVPDAPYTNNVGETYARLRHEEGCCLGLGETFRREQWIPGSAFEAWDTRADLTHADAACPHCFGERSLGDCQVTQRLHAIALKDAHADAIKVIEAWQDIETAPKDGTMVLGWYRGWDNPLVIYWYTGLNRWNTTMQPTHWMPLPDPPKAS